MAESVNLGRGLPKGYKFDRGGMPALNTPVIGVIKNNIDPARMGRVQVYIEEFGATNTEDQTNWTTVQYLSPFYGITPGPASQTADSFTNNRQSYGMWFTPPDIGTRVLCMFVNGDPSLGYYVGGVPEQGLVHMLPAIGSGTQGVEYNNPPSQVADAVQLPVIEINELNANAINSGTFYQQSRPLHTILVAEMYQQGTYLDTERGPISSSAQRESPSRVFGISTPGSPAAYQGGYTDSNFNTSVDANPDPSQLDILARNPGHSIVMDDGDVSGDSALYRLRSGKGHQIMMHDSGNFIQIIHSNGQTWIELGEEGTVDIYSTNSVNVRTQGDLNLHADQDINMYAGRNINQYAAGTLNTQSVLSTNILAQTSLNMTGSDIGQYATNSLNLQSGSGSWNVANQLNLVAGGIGLNSGGGATVTPVAPQTVNKLVDVKNSAASGWQIVVNGLDSIVTRAPTHEPYPYHNLGVNVTTSLQG